MHNARRAGFAAALAITFVMGGFILPDRATMSGPGLFRDVVTIISTRYIDSLDISAVYERAAEGLVSQLGDPYAELYSPEDMEDFTATYEGHYGGVGMMIESHQGLPVVRRVFPNTPAERRGVAEGDRVLTIDGDPVEGWPLERVANTLKGRPGSIVEVRFRRHGVPQPIMVRMTRAVVRIPAVPFSTPITDNVGYIPLLQFNETAAAEVTAALGELSASGATSVILDLRGNSGGMLDQAVRIAGLFLPLGAPVARQWERGGEDIRYVNERQPLAPDLPVVVLVDGASASAAEIVAGALQDHDRAVVVGSTSFGKGLVQTAYRVEGDYVLKLTTGKWYTPSGRSIHRERTMLAGRLVEVDDSVHFATGRDDRPTYRSVGGRLVYGGGGITPDLAVEPVRLDEAAEALVRALLPYSPEFHTLISDYATELKDQVERGFVVTQEWRDEVYSRLAGEGVGLDREIYDAGSRYVDRILADRIGRMAFGEAYAMIRDLGHDRPLLRGLEVIREGGLEQDGLLLYVSSIAQDR